VITVMMAGRSAIIAIMKGRCSAKIGLLLRSHYSLTIISLMYCLTTGTFTCYLAFNERLAM
jgi:hypothetical protein